MKSNFSAAAVRSRPVVTVSRIVMVGKFEVSGRDDGTVSMEKAFAYSRLNTLHNTNVRPSSIFVNLYPFFVCADFEELQ